MYEPYVTAEQYAAYGYSDIPTAERTTYLTNASRNVDKLTFNRIVAMGFSNLTEFQQELVRLVVCRQANFLYNNADALASVLDSYAINGVSMHFGTGFAVKMEDGIAIQNDVYSMLEQTGLCCRLAR